MCLSSVSSPLRVLADAAFSVSLIVDVKLKESSISTIAVSRCNSSDLELEDAGDHVSSHVDVACTVSELMLFCYSN